VNAGYKHPHAGSASTLVLHPAEWSPPHVPGVETMSYADAQGEGFHDFGDYDRFICLPVQYPSMAPRESTRWLMLRELGQCLERGASVLVLVPVPAEAPPPEVADDEPFNSTRQFLREITGGLKGAILDALPARRGARVSVTDLAPPHLKEHLGCCAPHFLTQFEDCDRVVLAECGRARPKPAVLVAHVGAGVWSAIPWTKGAPSEAEISTLLQMLDEVAQMASRPREITHSQAARPNTTPKNRLIRKGGTWEIGYEGESFHLPHVKGLKALAQVIQADGVEVAPFEILGRKAPRATSGEPACDRLTLTQVKSRKDALETKIEELKYDTTVDELDRQTEFEDLRDELAQLTEYERQATGPAGKARTLDRRWKRAQGALQKRLRTALEKIGEKSPGLMEHLDKALRTGHYRAYLPAGPSPEWEIRI